MDAISYIKLSFLVVSAGITPNNLFAPRLYNTFLWSWNWLWHNRILLCDNKTCTLVLRNKLLDQVGSSVNGDDQEELVTNKMVMAKKEMHWSFF